MKEELNCIIDTVQIKTDINNLKEFNDLTKENFNYITKLWDDINNSGAYKVVRFSPNKFKGYKLINTLSEFKTVMEVAMEEIGVIEKDKIKMERLDIAIDSKMKFADNFKLLLFLFETITYRDEKGDKWFTTNLKTLENNTIKKLNNSFEVVFYDKAEESNDHHLYNTRMEFRFKRISKADYEKYLNNLIDRISNIDNNIEPLEVNMAKRLIRLWEKEKAELKSFSEFVRKYNIYFYTGNILKEVYKATGLKGSYVNWLKKFKKTNSLNLYTKTDINNIKKEMIKSIKKYKKN